MGIKLGLAGVVLATCLTLSCGDNVQEQDPDAAKACRDLINAVAAAEDRCGGNGDFVHYLLTEQLADGDCANIDAIRSKTEMYEECLPSLGALSCDALQTPEACERQLIKL